MIVFKKPLLVCALISSFTSSFSQTSIIIERLQGDILIVTDSRRVAISESGEYRFLSVCKIKKYDNIYITIAGAITEPIYDTAIAVCKRYKGINQIASQLKNIEGKRFKIIMDSIAEHDKLFATNFERIRYLNIAFCTFENGIPKVIELDFDASFNKKQVSVKVSMNYFTNNPPKFGQMIEMGHHKYIDSTISADKSFFKNRTFLQSLIDLIKIECKEEPQSVGEPINILQIYEGGYMWIKNPTKCDF